MSLTARLMMSISVLVILLFPLDFLRFVDVFQIQTMSDRFAATDPQIQTDSRTMYIFITADMA